MASVPELVSYIRQQSQQGVAAPELRVALMEAGWFEADIDNAMHDVAAGLQPVTAGASIHEDLAQVRGMVAHLASRVKILEARLPAGQAGLTGQPAPEALPSGGGLSLPKGTIGSERELVQGRGSRWLERFVGVLADVVVLAFVGWYLAAQVARNDAMPVGLFATVGIIAAGVFTVAYHFMRRRRAWVANLMAASAIALWSIIVWHAWQTYHVLGGQTAIGLYVLLFVLLVVMGRWIERLSR
jgi:hypothetical protein